MRTPKPWVEWLGLDLADAGAVWVPRPGAPPSQVIYHHRHPEPEANLVLRGNGTYLIGTQSCHLEAGTLVWLFPGQNHCLVQRSPDFAMIIVVWSPASAARGAEELGTPELAQSDPGVHCRRLPAATARADRELLESLAATSRRERNLGLAYALARLWRHGQAGDLVPSAELPPALVRATRLLADPELGRTVSVASLARGAGLSADHFARQFRRHLGSAPLDYRNRCCLDRFLDRWRPGTELTSLASDCGFGSYASFHRCFRKAMGGSPRRWVEDTGMLN